MSIYFVVKVAIYCFLGLGLVVVVGSFFFFGVIYYVGYCLWIKRGRYMLMFEDERYIRIVLYVNLRYVNLIWRKLFYYDFNLFYYSISLNKKFWRSV